MSSVEDKKTRAMLEAATSPLSLFPLLAGTTGGLAMFAIGHMPVVGLAVAAGAVVWGVASALVRGVSSNSIKQKVERDVLEEKKQKRIHDLEDLRSNLEDEEVSLLDEILGLQKLIQSTAATDVTQGDIISSVNDLLEKSINILFRVPMLNELEGTVRSSKAALKVIREQKNKIIDGAKMNIEVATKAMAEFNSLGAGDGNQEETRRQLSVRLEAAKEFDGQLSALQLGGVSAELIAKYSKAS